MNITPTSDHSLEPSDLFPFALDSFQLQAIEALNTGQSVVVCVPTGSGKTLIGEYAIYRALATQKRVFYTTPLKALSNQKFRDFREQFGAENVGILTGDTSVNRDAAVLVMTTEIFRNMLYGTPIGQVGTSLEHVEAVVLDECHYMNDSQRGTVWEESIIYCPPKVQLVALSATVANAAELTEWIAQVHGPTQLIESDFRPVPLDFHFSNLKGLFPLLDAKQQRLNPRLKPKGGKAKQRLRKEDCPSVRKTVKQLQSRDMLPAIFFIFSRRGCDKAIEQVDDLPLVSGAEAAELRRRVEEFLAWNPSAARVGQVEPLMGGIAAHHAGVLPAWKGLVEELFQLGLVKVVFATETLAAGINMPARTTVISAISKRTDRGHRLLKAAEFLQMAGRAGRRGMDEQGYVVTAQTRFEGAKDAATLALKQAEPLVSQFTPTYGMVLNLLQTHSINEVKELLERSFAQYIATLKLKPEKQAIAELTTDLAKLDMALAPVNPKQVAHYEKLNQRLKAERKLLQTLQKQARELQQQVVSDALDVAVLGQVLFLKTQPKGSPPQRAVLVEEIVYSRHEPPSFICLTAENQWIAVNHQAIMAVGYGMVAQNLVDLLTSPLGLKKDQFYPGDEQSAAVAEAIPDESFTLEDAPEVMAQTQRMEAVQAQLENHPLNQWGKPGKLVKQHNRRIDLQQQLRDRQAQYKEHQTHHWQAFLNLVKVLREFDGLRDYEPTELGQAAAAIRGDNELWLGLVLLSGHLDDLDPQDLAAALYTFISEPPRSDRWTNYIPPESLLMAMVKLSPLRKELIKCQYRHKVALPVWLEDETLDFSGIITNWVLGASWEELCEHTNFDEGDLVRMLRRTVDLLSQIPHVPGVSQGLKQNAKRALDLMFRFPVEENVG
ncbi:MAG: DEAD/DEAH box helicase [Spirulina sp. SIO3F2]|nr:DEAD/DEAH box helicase [Spirulina sp. SIO3F2]